MKKQTPEPRTPPVNETITFCAQCYYLGTYADGSLHCRRMCPTIVPVPGRSAPYGLWPQVLATDWCAWGYNVATQKWNTPSGNEPGS